MLDHIGRIWSRLTQFWNLGFYACMLAWIYLSAGSINGLTLLCSKMRKYKFLQSDKQIWEKKIQTIHTRHSFTWFGVKLFCFPSFLSRIHIKKKKSPNKKEYPKHPKKKKKIGSYKNLTLPLIWPHPIEHFYGNRDFSSGAGLVSCVYLSAHHRLNLWLTPNHYK